MNRSELEHIIRAAARVTGEKEFIIIGSQAILGAAPDAPRELRESMEADIYPRDRPDLSEAIEGALGRYSSFHDTFEIYADGTGPETATLPPGWKDRLVPINGPGTDGATAWCLDPHDIAYSKLAAGREKDMAFITALRYHQLIQPSRMLALFYDTQDQELAGRLQARWQGIELRLSQRRSPERGL